MNLFKFEMGSTLIDVIHSLEGVVTGRAQYLTGCTQYHITPKGLDKEGKPREGYWIDEGRLKLKNTKQVVLPHDQPPGGPSKRDQPKGGPSNPPRRR
jgi:hypothetical protein